MPLPRTEDPRIGKSTYNMKCWIVGERAFVAETVLKEPSAGSSGQSTENRKEQERAEEEREVEGSSCVRLGGNQAIPPDPNRTPSDDGMIAIHNEDVNSVEEGEDDIAETAAPNEIVNIGEDDDANQLDLIDPLVGDETDIDPFDEDFAPSDDDEDEEVDEGPNYDPLDYDLPDLDDI
ncbi:hypothetical protein E8E11_008396 [Didymella keratinophila]|nr:hypothetical protein E8E11_008396 [Didymella keratinophila]